MTIREIAESEGLDIRRVQGWCARGRLPASRGVGGTWLVEASVWVAHRDGLLSERRGRKKGGRNA